jgi:hypothetical protein
MCISVRHFFCCRYSRLPCNIQETFMPTRVARSIFFYSFVAGVILLSVAIGTGPASGAGTFCAPPYAVTVDYAVNIRNPELALCKPDNESVRIGISPDSELVLDMGTSGIFADKNGTDLYFYESYLSHLSGIELHQTIIEIASDDNGRPGKYIPVFVWGDTNPGNNGNIPAKYLPELSRRQIRQTDLYRKWGIGINIGRDDDKRYRFVRIRVWPPMTAKELQDQAAIDAVEVVYRITPTQVPQDTATPRPSFTATPVKSSTSTPSATSTQSPVSTLTPTATGEPTILTPSVVVSNTPSLSPTETETTIVPVTTSPTATNSSPTEQGTPTPTMTSSATVGSISSVTPTTTSAVTQTATLTTPSQLPTETQGDSSRNEQQDSGPSQPPPANLPSQEVNTVAPNTTSPSPVQEPASPIGTPTAVISATNTGIVPPLATSVNVSSPTSTAATQSVTSTVAVVSVSPPSAAPQHDAPAQSGSSAPPYPPQPTVQPPVIIIYPPPPPQPLDLSGIFVNILSAAIQSFAFLCFARFVVRGGLLLNIGVAWFNSLTLLVIVPPHLPFPVSRWHMTAFILVVLMGTIAWSCWRWFALSWSNWAHASLISRLPHAGKLEVGERIVDLRKRTRHSRFDDFAPLGKYKVNTASGLELSMLFVLQDTFTTKSPKIARLRMLLLAACYRGNQKARQRVKRCLRSCLKRSFAFPDRL